MQGMAATAVRVGMVLAGVCSWAVAMLAEGGASNSLAESRVSLRQSVRLSDALAALAASGNAVVDLRPRLGQETSDPLLRLEADALPFWQVADAVAAEARLRLTPHIDRATGRPALGIQALAEGESVSSIPTAYVGPLRVRLKRTTALRDLADPQANRLVCILELAAEPRLEPILLRHERECVHYRFADQEGKASLAAGAGIIPWLGQAAIEVPVTLPLPPRAEKNLSELRGTFHVLVPPGPLSFHWSSLKAGEEQTRQGVSLQIADVSLSPGGTRCQVQVKIRYPDGTLGLESHQTWVFERNRLELRHRQTGVVLRPHSMQIGIDEGREVRITYTFRDLLAQQLADYEVAYQTFSTPVLYPLEFVLRELPLP